MIKTYIIAGLIAALVIGGLFNYAQNMRQQRDRKAEQLVTLQKNFDKVQEINAAQTIAIEKLQKEERQNDEKQNQIRDKIRTAPAGDDAPAAPVLARTFDELRKLQR